MWKKIIVIIISKEDKSIHKHKHKKEKCKVEKWWKHLFIKIKVFLDRNTFEKIANKIKLKKKEKEKIARFRC